jgi:hypothetical protein
MMGIAQAGKHAPGMAPVPPVKVGTAHKLRKRFYPDALWDRYCEKISEQERRHQAQQGSQKNRKGPPAPPSSSQPSRRFAPVPTRPDPGVPEKRYTSSSGPKFVSYPYTSWYCVIMGVITLGIGLVALSPVALMLSVGMLAIPVVIGSEDNVNHRSSTEDSGPR